MKLTRYNSLKSCVRALGLLIFLNAFTFLAKPAYPQNEINWNDWDVIPGKVIIEYSPSRSLSIKQASLKSSISGLALVPIESEAEKKIQTQSSQRFVSLLPNTFIGTFDPDNRDAVLSALRSDPSVVYFEPDRVRIPRITWGADSTNDPLFSSLWGMKRIGAPEAWKKQSSTRADVRVAVFEDAFDQGHRDLMDQVSIAQNPSDILSNHATHVAGTIAATGNNNLDVVGVANVELVSLADPADASDFVNKISWAINNGVDVINMSWRWCDTEDCLPCEYPEPSTAEQKAITAAWDDIVFVAAASNDACEVDGDGDAPIPVSYIGVIGVSALNKSDTLASFSNFGNYVDLAAPGVSIVSTLSPMISGSNTGTMSGTSMASPHVAGSAAAVLAVKNDYDIRSIPVLLSITAEDLGDSGRDKSFGNGLVRVDRAVAGIADVYVQLNPLGGSGSGILRSPIHDLDRALGQIADHETIGLKSDVFSRVIFNGKTISKPCTIISVGGTATIGN